MRSCFVFILVAATLSAGGAAMLAAIPPPPPVISASRAQVSTPNPLVWDALEKIHDAQPGEVNAEFVFVVTNSGSDPVEIKQIVPSCGCTVATMPSSPWVLAPGATGSFGAQLDFTGKQGVISKTLQVDSSRGNQTLRVTVNVPATDEAMRRRNQELARKDRQRVFQNDCAACHATPLAGKRGAQLFPGACGICHAAPSRADMVPDLQVAREPRDEAYWRKWISEGKAGTLMPAFARENGGPLSDEQVESLVEYALAALPQKPRVLPTPGLPAPGASASANP